MIREMINERIEGVLEKLGRKFEFKVEVPPEQFGDFSSNVALIGARYFRRPPLEVARDISRLLADDDLFESVEIAGPGFINFRISIGFLRSVISKVLREGDEYGRSDIGKGMRVQFEYGSANPTGPLTVGHGRQIVIGDVLSNVFRELGYDVDRELYLNDAGRQIKLLGKSLWVRYNELFGLKYEMPEDGYVGEYLVDVAKELKDEVGDTYKGVWNPDVEEYFKRYALKKMLASMKKTILKMGSGFDRYFSESSLIENRTVEKVINILKSKGLVYKKDGALWFKVSEFVDDDDKVLVRKDGTPTYFMTDIAYHYDKHERGYSRVYDIWGSDHHGHVPRMKAAMMALGFGEDFLTVIIHQFVTLKKGGEILRMSTRAGRFLTLDELIEQVGVDATRYFFAMIDPDKPMIFDMDLAVKRSMENPVYYVQYAHARVSSLFKQAEERGFEFHEGEDIEKLGNEHERRVMKRLDLLEDIIKEVANTFSPAKLTKYLEDLAHDFHVFYTHNTILDPNSPELSNARLNLSLAVQKVVKKGLRILGVRAPNRM